MLILNNTDHPLQPIDTVIDTGINTVFCPLCAAPGDIVCVDAPKRKIYLKCTRCDLFFLRPCDRLSAADEKTQYDYHENDVSDLRYQAFVSPLYQQIRLRFTPLATGLDFGAGPGPVLATMLRRDGYVVDVYDPIYWPDKTPLKKQYDFVVACEVVEHFYSPLQEFELLFSLLKPGGILALMTLTRDEETAFASWHYRIDPTHVAFYSHKTFCWIKDRLGFTTLAIDGKRLAIFRR